MENNSQVNTTLFQRIAPEQIPQFIGQPVTIVGEIVPSDSKDSIILKTDTETVRIMGTEGGSDQKLTLEVRGYLNPNGSLQISEFTTLDNENQDKPFDINLYYKVVRLMQGEFKELFYEK